jgi:hypothetical protein
MVKKRGQAAMEFLMTYGWALLVVLIAIGALAFFGVLNPGQFLPSTCTIAPGISCDGFKVTEDSVELILTNGMGTTLGVAGDLFTVYIFQDAVECGSSTGELVGLFGDGKTDKFEITPLAAGCVLAEGGKAKLDIQVTYKIGADGLSHTKTGQIFTKVEQ